MFDEERKYFLKSILLISISAIASLVVIISLGIFALTYEQEPRAEQETLGNTHIQNAKTSELLSELAFKITQNNSERTFATIDNYLRNPQGFRLVPNIPFDEINFENVPELYHNNTKICANDANSENQFVNNLKIAVGSEILIYQRVNIQGDMYLLCSSLYNIPNGFKLKYIKSDIENQQGQKLIDKISSGQVFHTVQDLNGTLYSLSFRRIIDKRGSILGMIAVSTKLSGYLDFSSVKLAESFNIIESIGNTYLYKSNSGEKQSYSSDKINKIKTNSDNTFIDESYGLAGYKDSRLNWILVSEIPPKRKPMPAGIRENGYKMAFSAGFLVLIVIIFYAVKSSDKLKKKFDRKTDCMMRFLNNIIIGNYSENENDISMKIITQGRPGKECSTEYFDLMRRLNTKMSDLERDKLDMIDILDSKLLELKTFASRLNFIKEESMLLIESSVDKFSDMSVKMSQVSNIMSDMSIWDSFNELASKLQVDAGTDKIRETAQNLNIKSGIINDKAEKVFSELNSMKKISDHAYLISINSAIFAEKANSNKLALLSEEVRRLSENLSNATDQVYYLLSEAKNAAGACNTDIQKINEAIAKSPKPSDISEMVIEFSRFNEKAGSLSMKFANITEEGRILLKSLESCKSTLDKATPVLKNLNDLTSGI